MSQLQSFSNSPIKTSKIIGANVVDARGDSLGNIIEIVMDPYTGRATYSVVAFGGFLGMGEKLFAIPFSAFAYNVKKMNMSSMFPKNVCKLLRASMRSIGLRWTMRSGTTICTATTSCCPTGNSTQQCRLLRKLCCRDDRGLRSACLQTIGTDPPRNSMLR